MSVVRSLCLAVAVLFALPASAHLLAVEEESRSPHPWWTNDGDASFAEPFDLPFNLLDSQAIFAWLDAGDVDVYRFTVTPADFLQARQLRLPAPFVFASPIPPACFMTRWNYPAIALVAPFGTAPVEDPALHDLPFDVPPGHGVLPVFNTRVYWPERRPIFELPPDDTEIPLNLSWFLPTGCTVDPFDCTKADSLAAPVFVIGTTAYLVVWDPWGLPQDYTLNLGIDESNFQSFPEIEQYVQDNGHLHFSCHPPYWF